MYYTNVPGWPITSGEILKCAMDSTVDTLLYNVAMRGGEFVNVSEVTQQTLVGHMIMTTH